MLDNSSVRTSSPSQESGRTRGNVNVSYALNRRNSGRTREGPDGYSETRWIDSIVDRCGNNVNERGKRGKKRKRKKRQREERLEKTTKGEGERDRARVRDRAKPGGIRGRGEKEKKKKKERKKEVRRKERIKEEGREQEGNGERNREKVLSGGPAGRTVRAWAALARSTPAWPPRPAELFLLSLAPTIVATHFMLLPPSLLSCLVSLSPSPSLSLSLSPSGSFRLSFSLSLSLSLSLSRCSLNAREDRAPRIPRLPRIRVRSCVRAIRQPSRGNRAEVCHFKESGNASERFTLATGTLQTHALHIAALTVVHVKAR